MDISLILVPSEGARIDDYWIIGDGCIKISWHPISEERSNGVIQGYNIYYELACHFTSAEIVWNLGHNHDHVFVNQIPLSQFFPSPRCVNGYK